MALNPLNDFFQPRSVPGNPMQMLTEFQRFAQGMTPQKARQQVEQLLTSGKMTRQQFDALQQQAKAFMQFFGKRNGCNGPSARRAVQ